MAIEKFETEVKEVLLKTGFRHKNRVLEIRDCGNGVDSLSRRAWFRFDVKWLRPPSTDLLAELAGLPPIRPSIQAYAGDIDRIDLMVSSRN